MGGDRRIVDLLQIKLGIFIKQPKKKRFVTQNNNKECLTEEIDEYNNLLIV